VNDPRPAIDPSENRIVHMPSDAELWQLFRSLPDVGDLPAAGICWCGHERKPGQDHGLCYPGME
jgi:hypothetical protein